jgi:hypothetical protein
MITTHTKTGLSLVEELERRGGCRYGLRGVKVRVHGHPGLFKVWATYWGAGQQLFLTLYPAVGPEPIEVQCVDPEHHDLFHTAACFDSVFPAGTIRDMGAERVTLASRWPVVCCRPRRSRGRKS